MARPYCLLAVSMLLPLIAPCAAAPTTTARDVVLLIDNSGSMRQNDPQFLTRRAVAEFLQSLTANVRAAIVIFDQKVRVAAPLTRVTESTRPALLEKLAIIDYRGRFTNSPAGMERAIYELRRHGRPDAEKIVIFMTDGIVDTGEPMRDRELARWLREALAGEAAAAGIRVFGIAFTEAADFQLIQTLTFKTRGSYFRAATAEEIGGVFGRINALLQHSEPAHARAHGLSSQTVHPRTPSADTAPEPAAAAAPVTSQPSAWSPVELLKTEEPVAHSAIEQSTTLEGKTALERQGESAAPLFPSSSRHTSIPKPPSADAQQPTPWGIPIPSILVILGCGLAAVVALAITVLLWRRPRHVFAELAPAAATPVTTRYPPPFCLLKDLSGATRRDSHDITGRLTRISRSPTEDCPSMRTLVIKDDYISREHAVIEYRDYGYWIVDRGSVNGSFVNDERVTADRLLKHGDRLRFHTYEFEIVLPEMEGEAKTELALIVEAEDQTVVSGSKQAAPGSTQTDHRAALDSSRLNIPRVEERNSAADLSVDHTRK